MNVTFQDLYTARSVPLGNFEVDVNVTPGIDHRKMIGLLASEDVGKVG